MYERYWQSQEVTTIQLELARCLITKGHTYCCLTKGEWTDTTSDDLKSNRTLGLLGLLKSLEHF